MTARKYSQHRIVRIGLPRQDCREITARTGRPGRTARKDRQHRTARTGLPGQDCQPRSQNRISKTGQPGRTVQIFSITSSQFKKILSFLSSPLKQFFFFEGGIMLFGPKDFE
jgi:hypothetical protein